MLKEICNSVTTREKIFYFLLFIKVTNISYMFIKEEKINFHYKVKGFSELPFLKGIFIS